MEQLSRMSSMSDADTSMYGDIDPEPNVEAEPRTVLESNIPANINTNTNTIGETTSGRDGSKEGEEHEMVVGAQEKEHVCANVDLTAEVNVEVEHKAEVGEVMTAGSASGVASYLRKCDDDTLTNVSEHSEKLIARYLEKQATVRWTAPAPATALADEKGAREETNEWL